MRFNPKDKVMEVVKDLIKVFVIIIAFLIAWFTSDGPTEAIVSFAVDWGLLAIGYVFVNFLWDGSRDENGDFRRAPTVVMGLALGGIIVGYVQSPSWQAAAESAYTLLQGARKTVKVAARNIDSHDGLADNADDKADRHDIDAIIALKAAASPTTSGIAMPRVGIAGSPLHRVPTSDTPPPLTIAAPRSIAPRSAAREATRKQDALRCTRAGKRAYIVVAGDDMTRILAKLRGRGTNTTLEQMRRWNPIAELNGLSDLEPGDALCYNKTGR